MQSLHDFGVPMDCCTMMDYHIVKSIVSYGVVMYHNDQDRDASFFIIITTNWATNWADQASDIFIFIPFFLSSQYPIFL